MLMKALGLGVTISLFVIAAALLPLTMSRVKEIGKYKNKTLIYFFLTALCFGIAGLFGLTSLLDDLTTFFIVLQIMVLIIGILHSVFIYKMLPWTSKNKFLWEFLFSFSIACLGALLLLLVFKFIVGLEILQYLMLSAVFWFFVPFLFIQAFYRYIAIPSKVFRKWYYPVGKEIADPLDSELVALLVVSFVFHKKMNDPEITTFRAKAPQKMVFGRLFYYFINDYNERHPESSIEFIDQGVQPFGWVFYLKPRWIGIRRYIDPDQIIRDNRIKENSIIVCQRIKEN